MNAEIAESVTEFDEHEAKGTLPVVIESGMIGTLVKAELDTAIETALAHPRNVHQAMEDILTLATLDERTAEDNMYALPRGGKPIKGPSVRLAEIIYQNWGNCWVDARVVAVDKTNKVVVARGTYRDLQKNATISREVQRPIANKRGQLYTDDMITMTGNAASAIALRNAILAGVPKGIWWKAYLACEDVVAGTAATLTERRDKALKAFAVFGVKPEQLFGAVGVKGIEDITREHLPTLIAMHSALKSGEATVEEMFDPRKTAATHEVVANPLKDEPAKEAVQEPVRARVDYFEGGVAAHHQGVPREKPPGELRGGNRDPDLLQWYKGWDSVK